VRFIWEVGDRGAISRGVWTRVNERLVGKTISRASIINFLNAMVDEGVLDYHEGDRKNKPPRYKRGKLSRRLGLIDSQRPMITIERLII